MKLQGYTKIEWMLWVWDKNSLYNVKTMLEYLKKRWEIQWDYSLVECMVKRKWRPFCHNHFLGGKFQGANIRVDLSNYIRHLPKNSPNEMGITEIFVYSYPCIFWSWHFLLTSYFQCLALPFQWRLSSCTHCICHIHIYSLSSHLLQQWHPLLKWGKWLLGQNWIAPCT